MRRTIMISAMSLVLSATEVAAACPVISGLWKLSMLIVPTAIATDCVIEITPDGRIVSTGVPPCFGDFAPDDLLNQQLFLQTGTSGCGFLIPVSGGYSAGGCDYRGELNGEIGAGILYCRDGRRGTFDLVRTFQ